MTLSFSALSTKPRLGLVLGVLIAALLQVCSGGIDPYTSQVMIFAAINVILAVSLNLVMGETGQFSLCHAAFMAVGAYASALITGRALPALLPHLSWTGSSWASQASFLPVLVCAGLVAAVAGLIVGGPSLRLRGDYLAMVTLGFGEIIRVLLQNTNAVGGARGMEGILPATNLFWAVGVAVVTLYTMMALVRSTYGKGFHAVRDDEIAAAAMGIDTTRFKVTAFVIGAFFAGVAGALYAHAVQFISPEGFNFLRSFEIIVMVILGGLGRPVGVAVAAILITLLNEWLRDLSGYRMVVYALIIILFMILRPGDRLAPLWRQLRTLLPSAKGGSKSS
ncbi:MAG: branched-chain amino acid ABC transporter permease [Verrucomicrobiota bacterium]